MRIRMERGYGHIAQPLQATKLVEEEAPYLLIRRNETIDLIENVKVAGAVMRAYIISLVTPYAQWGGKLGFHCLPPAMLD